MVGALGWRRSDHVSHQVEVEPSQQTGLSGPQWFCLFSYDVRSYMVMPSCTVMKFTVLGIRAVKRALTRRPATCNRRASRLDLACGSRERVGNAEQRVTVGRYQPGPAGQECAQTFVLCALLPKLDPK